METNVVDECARRISSWIFVPAGAMARRCVSGRLIEKMRAYYTAERVERSLSKVRQPLQLEFF
jgi:hypothetical protein